MKLVETDAELAALHASGRGLVYNDFSGHGPSGVKYNILHTASCTKLRIMTVDVPKVFFDRLDEAVAWLEKNRGTNWKICNSCKAIYKSTAVNGERIAFREGEVCRFLVEHMRQAGFKVLEKVKVPNGTIDISASRPGENWVVEVKGETLGGFTSAEMNFQVGVGQLVSRMCNAEDHYALAIPMTPNFKQVLRKYRETVGFRRLGLVFFLVDQDGSVQQYDADEMVRFMDTLT